MSDRKIIHFRLETRRNYLELEYRTAVDELCTVNQDVERLEDDIFQLQQKIFQLSKYSRPRPAWMTETNIFFHCDQPRSM